MELLILPKKKDRQIGQKYIRKENEIVIWNGTKLLCQHNKRKDRCIDCGGSGICPHNKQKNRCIKCGGNSICTHNKLKYQCKDCCNGVSVCQHNKLKWLCYECGGVSVCHHNRRKTQCIECGGVSICQHNRRKNMCIECGGNNICPHNKEKYTCKICDPNGHLSRIMRSRTYKALKYFNDRKDKKHTLEYIGCSIEELKFYLESQFETESLRCGNLISWENQGQWHIDHIKPCASFDLDQEEERHKCFHYTNVQPMWGPDNLSKSATYDETKDNRIWTGKSWIKKSD
jgi:hypothetical protein